MPDRILRAIDMPTIDHRGPDFGELGKAALSGLQAVFQTSGPVVIYPASGTGAWEAAIVNTPRSPGDRVLLAETGQFAALWSAMAKRLRLNVDVIPGGLAPRCRPRRDRGAPRRRHRPRHPRGDGGAQ